MQLLLLGLCWHSGSDRGEVRGERERERELRWSKRGQRGGRIQNSVRKFQMRRLLLQDLPSCPCCHIETKEKRFMKLKQIRVSMRFLGSRRLRSWETTGDGNTNRFLLIWEESILYWSLVIKEIVSRVVCEIHRRIIGINAGRSRIRRLSTDPHFIRQSTLLYQMPRLFFQKCVPCRL